MEPYVERLTVPWRWWVQAIMFFATLWIAFVVATPLWLATSVSAGLLAVAGGLFVWIGSARIEIDAQTLRAGRAQIPLRLLGPAEALGREATRAALGPEADARAYMLTRPYLKDSVKVRVDDPADPTPYWILNTRHAAALATALDAATSASSPASD